MHYQIQVPNAHPAGIAEIFSYMDSSRFASISSLLDWGTTAHVYPAFELSAIALAIMGYSRVCS